MFKHRVQDGEQLTHAGGKSYLFGLPCGTETLVEAPDNGVITRRYQGSHVESCPYRGPSSPHSALALEGATVAVKGCDTYQSSYLSAVQCAQFEKFGQNIYGCYSQAIKTPPG